MEGKLFVYHPERRLVAFLSDCCAHAESASPVEQESAVPARDDGRRNVVVFIGGLTDGFLATPYLPHLQSALAARGWGLVQTLLSSSYSGYGHSNLRQDVTELDALVLHLVEKERAGKVVLLGHSTGCQDIVLFMKEGVHRDKINGVILQAPVSDREYASSQPQTERLLQLASEMLKQGRGHEMMPREADMYPITAYRYHSFASRLGDDDMFSSDFTVEEVESRLGHMVIPCLIYLSLQDEYVPASVDKRKLLALFENLPGAVVKTDEEANHNLSSPAGASTRFIDEVMHFLNTVCALRT